MKRIILSLTMGILLLSTVGCGGDELDINTNPNTPVDVPKEYYISAGQASIVNTVGGELNNLGSFWAQYYTQSTGSSQYQAYEEYNIDASASNDVWNELYAGALNDLQYVITESDKTGDTSSKLVASLMQAYAFQILIDLFGKVPYSEFGQSQYPKYDEGETVYPALIKKIDEAVAAYKANPSSNNLAKYDMIYKGDMTKWVQFANTLKLKLYLRMAYTSQADATKVKALLAENNFILADAGFKDIYADTGGKMNPFYSVNISGDGFNGVNHVASSSLLKFLEENGDIRIATKYKKNSTGAYFSMPQGAKGQSAYKSLLIGSFSTPNISAKTPVYIFTLAESKFLQAEADIRYNGGSNAKTLYNEGVKASFVTEGLTGTDATSLLASGGNYELTLTGVVETDIEKIMIQKWVALANYNAIEGFFEANRTHYPKMEVYTSGTDYKKGRLTYSLISVIQAEKSPKSLYYAAGSINTNPNAPKQKTGLTEKVWWDLK